MKLTVRCPKCSVRIEIIVKALPAVRSKSETLAKELDPLLGKEHDNVLAARFGIHQATVRNRRRRLGIPGRRKILDREREAEVIILRRKQLTQEEIGLRSGISRERVRQILKRAGMNTNQEKRKSK